MAKDNDKPESKGRKLPKIRFGAKKILPTNEADAEIPKRPAPESNPKSITTRIKLPADAVSKTPLKPRRVSEQESDFPQAVDDEKVREAAKNATARILIDEDMVSSEAPTVITSSTDKEKTMQIDLGAIDEDSNKSQTIRIDFDDLDEDGSASQTLEISLDAFDAGAVGQARGPDRAERAVAVDVGALPCAADDVAGQARRLKR